MDRYNNVVASLCGGALVGEFIIPGVGALVGGLFGTCLAWPRRKYVKENHLQN